MRQGLGCRCSARRDSAPDRPTAAGVHRTDTFEDSNTEWPDTFSGVLESLVTKEYRSPWTLEV